MTVDEMLDLIDSNIDDVYENVPAFIQNINFSLLKQQKATLVAVIGKQSINDLQANELEGILSLLDSLQDYAVDEMGVDENEVFDLTDEDGE